MRLENSLACGSTVDYDLSYIAITHYQVTLKTISLFQVDSYKVLSQGQTFGTFFLVMWLHVTGILVSTWLS